MSTRTLASMRANMPAFGNEFAHARKLGADLQADEMDEVRDPEKWPDINRAKAWLDQRRWKLSRQFRDEYGDRVDVAVNVTVDLGAALRDAKARALRPTCDPADAIDAEYREIPSTCDAGPSDNKSYAPVPAVIPPPSIFD